MWILPAQIQFLKARYLFKQFEVDHEEDFVSRTYCLIYYLLNVSFLQ